MPRSPSSPRKIQGRYASVVCPRCHHAFGIDTARKRSSCPRCGTSSEVRRLRKYFGADRPSEAAAAVRALESQLHGGPRPPSARRVKRPFAAIARRALAIKGTEARAWWVVQELTRRQGEFTERDLAAVLRLIGSQKASSVLAGLRAQALLVERGPDRYAAISL